MSSRRPSGRADDVTGVLSRNGFGEREPSPLRRSPAPSCISCWPSFARMRINRHQPRTDRSGRQSEIYKRVESALIIGVHGE
jgi:hypothetical protein